ncbi:MAG: GGDEF domain-containing protein [Gallionellaceae bacterium]
MSNITEELANAKLFNGVSESILQLVEQHAQPFELKKGELLLSPDQHNEHVFIILSGKLGLHFGVLNSPEIRELHKGDSVGEISIIDGKPPSAYVVAKESCRLFPIKRDLLHNFIQEASPIANNLLMLMTNWMRDSTHRIVHDREQIWELTDNANVDSLTKLYNRRWLDNMFPRLHEQSVKGGNPLCILMIDVDHFKEFNDTHGHLGGDHALIALGEVLKNSVRAYDFAVRYGGEEFMVILPNSSKEDGIAAAERIRYNAETKLITSTEGALLPSITTSIGLAMNEASYNTVQSIIAAADAQLYRAKLNGRNCVRYE